jgi:hypothetical protein
VTAPLPSAAIPIPLYLTRRQVTEHLGLGESEIEQAFRDLAVYQVEGRRKVRVHRDEIIAWMESRRVEKGEVRAA